MDRWLHKMIRAWVGTGGTIVLHSPRTPIDISTILGKRVKKLPSWFTYADFDHCWDAPSTIYGTVSIDGFELRSSPRSRESLTAVGKVKSTKHGSTIEITFKEPWVLYRFNAAVFDRYGDDLENILNWLNRQIDTDDVTDLPSRD